MYSPKIREELIPEIYRIARARGIRITTLVNSIIEKALDEMKDGNIEGINNEGIPDNQASGEEE